ncbi:hypothetical protein, partial [Escherichia coli]|uniref:hypothetical protein n=1 Tax=Escherichia coli TaxID=562 RepID=UPI0029C1C927
ENVKHIHAVKSNGEIIVLRNEPSAVDHSIVSPCDIIIIRHNNKIRNIEFIVKVPSLARYISI